MILFYPATAHACRRTPRSVCVKLHYRSIACDLRGFDPHELRIYIDLSPELSSLMTRIASKLAMDEYKYLATKPKNFSIKLSPSECASIHYRSLPSDGCFPKRAQYELEGKGSLGSVILDELLMSATRYRPRVVAIIRPGGTLNKDILNRHPQLSVVNA